MQLEDLSSRKVLYKFSCRFTAQDFRYWIGFDLPSSKRSIIQGNLLVEIYPDGKNTLTIPDNQIKHESLRRYLGPAYIVVFTYYAMTDGEMCWRH